MRKPRMNASGNRRRQFCNPAALSGARRSHVRPMPKPCPVNSPQTARRTIAFLVSLAACVSFFISTLKDEA
ncbi:hypothetical protein CEXT_526401 [Caerostris extrusa]|uniref:Transmembrane protein n=1 Tax=Caerostris extrusa TaxID=172846 RepID=A0AAV4XDB9_CAEEX|nr:hypothetical protein CEXT_526401 [Caerostris extrusa]